MNNIKIVNFNIENHKINPNSILMLIGDGELEDTIKNKVREYELLDSVLFLGSRSDVAELMQAMDIFVFPSFFEGLGIVTIEARAAGLPVLTSKQVPIETKVSDLIRYISIEDSPLGWAENINSLKVYIRKNMKNEIVQAGFDVNGTALKLQEFYTSVNI